MHPSAYADIFISLTIAQVLSLTNFFRWQSQSFQNPWKTSPVVDLNGSWQAPKSANISISSVLKWVSQISCRNGRVTVLPRNYLNGFVANIFIYRLNNELLFTPRSRQLLLRWRKSLALWNKKITLVVAAVDYCKVSNSSPKAFREIEGHVLQNDNTRIVYPPADSAQNDARISTDIYDELFGAIGTHGFVCKTMSCDVLDSVI